MEGTIFQLQFFFVKMLNLRVKLLTTHLIFQTFAKLRFDQSHIYACVSTTKQVYNSTAYSYTCMQRGFLGFALNGSSTSRFCHCVKCHMWDTHPGARYFIFRCALSFKFAGDTKRKCCESQAVPAF